MSKNTLSQCLKEVARKILPDRTLQMYYRGLKNLDRLKRKYSLFGMKLKTQKLKPGALVKYLNYTMRINDGLNFYMLCKDIFDRRIYHFEAQSPEPFVLDCGSNIGMSILYYKHVYPQARVIGFEPDSAIYPYLRENIEANKLTDVQLFQMALAETEGKLDFYSDGKYGSTLNETSAGPGWKKYEVPCVRLSQYVNEPVDFLKMNIEGAEWEVLNECGEKLKNVREMVIEYHHLPGLARTLHEILGLLNEVGFEYMINDFDSQSNPGVNAPFSLTPESRYFLLIYAKRKD